MAHRLVRAQNTCKDIRIHSFHHTHTHTCTYVSTHARTHTHTQKHTHTHTTHADTHTHTCTHTHTTNTRITTSAHTISPEYKGSMTAQTKGVRFYTFYPKATDPQFPQITSSHLVLRESLVTKNTATAV